MSTAATWESWLPAHQGHVLYTVGHVDSTIEQLGSVLHDYLAADPLKLESRFQPTIEQVVLVGIDPLPDAVPRMFADALNQTRNMLEHAFFAEVSQRAERDLTEKELKALEVPASKSPELFEQWCNHPHRRSLGLFGYGSELRRRLERIQPYQRTDDDAHPLRVLVEHTNYAKHRAPAVAFTRVGRVDVGATSRSRRAAEHQEVIEIGAVLAAVPRGTRVEASVWPQVMVQRPHTKQWRTLMHEVGYIEDWVRRMALPIVLAGRTDLPPIPPHLDVRRGHPSVSEAWASAGNVAAADRNTSRMVAEGLRRDIVEMIVDEDGESARQPTKMWLDGQSDVEVKSMFDPLSRAALRQDLEAVARITDQWRAAIGLQPREDA